MPKFKLFKLLSLTHKNAEPLHRLPSPRPVDTNLVVTQLTRTSDIPTTIDNDLLHSSKITETQPTITSAEETTNDITNKPSTAKSKHNDDLSGICTSSSPTQKPQNIYSQSPATDIPNFLTEPANSKSQTRVLQPPKQRRHQHRLCYHCRQTGHSKSRCPKRRQKRNQKDISLSTS